MATPVKQKRKSKHSEKKAAVCEKVLELMHDGMSMTKAAKAAGIAPMTFSDWVSADDALSVQYARARQASIEKLEEELLEITDEIVPVDQFGKYDSAAVQKQRLQVDTRKWLLSKLMPKTYGDKIQTELTGADGGPIKIQDASKLTDDQLAAIAKGKSKPA